MRVVSKAMARRLRARGIEVVDTDAKVVAFRVAPGEHVTVPPPAPLAPPPAAFDLTDEELERLTAPDGES